MTNAGLDDIEHESMSSKRKELPGQEDEGWALSQASVSVCWKHFLYFFPMWLVMAGFPFFVWSMLWRCYGGKIIYETLPYKASKRAKSFLDLWSWGISHWCDLVLHWPEQTLTCFVTKKIVALVSKVALSWSFCQISILQSFKILPEPDYMLLESSFVNIIH